MFVHGVIIMMLCSKCGKKISDNSMFCSHCGAKVTTKSKDSNKKTPGSNSTKAPMAKNTNKQTSVDKAKKNNANKEV